MGKQINFYMSEEIQQCFVEHLIQNQFQLVDRCFNTIEKPCSCDVYHMYLYKAIYGKIVMQSNGNYIDTLKSPVIEFNKTSVKAEKHMVLRGRLWISDCYYENGILISQKPEFIKDYQALTRWIKKRVPRQKIKKGKYLVDEYACDELVEMQKEGFVLTI